LSLSALIGFVASYCAQDNVLAELDGTVVIDSISPIAGPVGSQVKIYGKGFSAIRINNQVSINTAKATVLEPASLTALIIEVPVDATSGFVSLKVNNVIAQGPLFTVVDPPIIQSVSPLEGLAGYRVVITGLKLAQVTRVDFNGVPGEIFSQTATEIVAIAPNSATGVIELVFPEGKVTGPVFTYLPIPVIDTAAVVLRGFLEDVIYKAIAFLGRDFSADASKLKAYVNGQTATILEAAVASDGRPYVVISMPPPEADNPTTLEIESEGIKSLPYEFIIPPELSDLSVEYLDDSFIRIRLRVYGSYFGAYDPSKVVNVVHVGPNTPVPTTVQSWTPQLITLELNILHGEYYDVSVVVKGKSSEPMRFRP
jgi:hypothetical protein